MGGQASSEDVPTWEKSKDVCITIKDDSVRTRETGDAGVVRIDTATFLSRQEDMSPICKGVIRL